MSATERKLADCQTQLSLARAHEHDEAIVRSCVNAFVALARSVTLVMQSESGSGTPLTAWYQDRMSRVTEKDLFRFFNNQRVLTTHRGTISVDKKYFSRLAETSLPANHLYFAPGGEVWVFEGTEKYGLRADHPALPLCETYLSILTSIVHEWLTMRASAA